MGTLWGPLSLMIAAAVASRGTVDDRVCYIGQEPHPDIPNTYGWVETDTDPAGCSLVLLGGLNTGRYAAAVSGRGTLTSPGESRSTEPPAAPCQEDKPSDRSVEPCDTITNPGTEIGVSSAPIERLEFEVRPLGSGPQYQVTLDLLQHSGDTLYTIDVTQDSLQLVCFSDGHYRVDWKQLDGPSRLWVTSNNCEIKVGLHDSAIPLVRLSHPSNRPGDIYSVHISGLSGANLDIYMPCRILQDALAY